MTLFANLPNAVDQIAPACPQQNRDCRTSAPVQSRRRQALVEEERSNDRLAGVTIELISALDWSQCPAVESVPGRVSGAWTFRNSRTPVQLIFENLEDGMTIDEIIEQYPVSREEIKAVLDFAAHSLDRAPSF
jgi:uncharacterized protein (DUF433 family)